MPKLTIDIEARLAQFQDKLTGIGRSADRTARQMESAFSGLRGVMASLGASLSVAGLVAFVKSGIDAADGLNKLSQRVGVSVESLSAFQFAAKLSNVEAEQFTVGLQKLAKSAFEAQSGTGEAADTFKALGINVKNAGGNLKSTEQLLLETADRFAGIEDGAGKTAIAMRLFGRAGAELIPLLNQGSAGFEQLRAEAERLGIIISSKTAKAAEDFNDNVTRLNQSMTALKISMAEGVLPGLSKWIEANLEMKRIAGSTGEALRLFVFNLDAMTSEEPRQEIERLTKALENFQKAGAVGKFMQSPTGSIFGGREEDIKKQIELLKFLQRQQALALGAGVNDNREFARAGSLPGGTPKRPAPTLPDRERDAQFQNAIKQLQDEANKVQDLTRFEEVLSAIEQGRYGKLTAGQKTRLESLAAEVDLARENTKVQTDADAATKKASDDAAQKALHEAEAVNVLTQKYKDLADPFAQLIRQREEIASLSDKGILSPEEAAAATLAIDDLIESMQGLGNKTKITLDEMGEFAKQAARNMQDAFATGLFDLMQGQFDDLAGSFKRTVDRMVADALSAKLLHSLLGDMDKTGKAGGFIGDTVLPFFAGIFKASGGPVNTGNPFVVGEKGPELFVPQSAGTIMPNGKFGGNTSVTMNMNVSVSGAVDRRSLSQIQAAAGEGVQRALARNT